MTNVFRHLKFIKYKDEKQRLVVFGIGLILILILSSYLFSVAYSRYEIRSRVLANIDKALYIFGTDNINFNLEPEGIIPSNTPHVYKFTVSNYNDKHDSDVDLKYKISIRTTTNLPKSIGLIEMKNIIMLLVKIYYLLQILSKMKMVLGIEIL